MFTNRIKVLFMIMSIAALMALAACGGGGGGGGGGGDNGGANLDNSRADGFFTFVLILFESGDDTPFTVLGTLDFNGSGIAAFHIEEPLGGPGDSNIPYTVTTDNVISIAGLKGTLSASGDFFAATDTKSDGDIGLLIAMKNPTSVVDESLLDGEYIGGPFIINAADSSSATKVLDLSFNGFDTGSAAELYPDAGNLPDFAYAIDAGGNYTGHLQEAGVVSANGDLLLSVDTDPTGDLELFSHLALKKTVGVDLTNSVLSGTYVLHQFMDDNISGTSFVTARASAIFNGDGTGSYQTLASSGGGGDGDFTYIVNTATDDGTFTLVEEDMFGMMSPDGSVISLIDHDDSDNSVSVMVGVKK